MKLLFLIVFMMFGCGQTGSKNLSNSANGTDSKDTKEKMVKPEGLEYATFGSGCFWCTEAVFEELIGVHEVVSGFAGGHIKNPTYREVCTGTTGHAEVARIGYDPKVISFETLLDVF